MKVGDKVRVLPSCKGPHPGQVGTITRLEGDVASIRSPMGNHNFTVHVDFLEDFDWDEDSE